MDAFAHLDDEALRALQEEPEPSLLPTAEHEEDPSHRFRYDDYNWDGFRVPGQVTVKLSQGYFTFIDEEDLDKLQGRKISASGKLCPVTRELIRVRAVFNLDGEVTLLHRFLTGAKLKDGSVVDHVNNLPLDNRRSRNLWRTSSSANNGNRFFERTVNAGLKRGVKVYGQKYRGQIQYRGVTYFSDLLSTENAAHEWYLAKYREFHGISEDCKRPERNNPIFPPLKEEKVVVPPAFMAHAFRQAQSEKPPF
jgi:hypothetical protein